MPTLNPIYNAVIDGQRTQKNPFRQAWSNFAYSLENVAALRDHDARGQKLIFVGQNLFKYDAADTTTADDGVNCIHDSTGKRYKWLQFASGTTTAAALAAHIAAVDPHTNYGLSFANRAAVTATNLSALATGSTIYVRGRVTEGIGGARYKALAAAPVPVQSRHLQSSDGKWFIVDEQDPDVTQLGDCFQGNDAAVIQAIADFLGSNSTIKFPPGSFNFTGQVTISNQNVQVIGAGKSETQINFAPTVDGLAVFNFTAGAAVQFNCSVIGIGFYSANTTLEKTVIRSADSSNMQVFDIYVNGAFNGGGTSMWGGGTSGSIALDIAGREFGLYRDLSLFAQRPIVFRANPNNDIHLDHYNFHNIYMIGNGYPLIECVGNKTHITDLSFTGAQAWVGGTHGFYKNQTGDTVVSSGIVFNNVGLEQGTSPTSYGIYISSNLVTYAVDMKSCNFEPGREGVFLNNVSRTLISTSVFSQAAGRTALNFTPATGAGLTQIENFWEVGGTVTLSANLKENYASPKFNTGAALPASSSYTWFANNISDYKRIDGVRERNFKFTLAASGLFDLQCGSSSGMTSGMVIVSFKGATKMGGGMAAISNLGGTTTVQQAAATTDFGVGNVAGKLTIFGDTLCRVFNQTGESQEVSVKVMLF